MTKPMRLTASLFVILCAPGCAAPAAAMTGAADDLAAARAPHPLAADPKLGNPARQAGRTAWCGFGYTDASPH
jgi:hypothetical protein